MEDLRIEDIKKLKKENIEEFRLGMKKANEK